MTEQTPNATAFDPELLAILRCPVAVQNGQEQDPGKLELYGDCWLVCAESGLKYPIRDGIAVMLVEEGEKWKDTEKAELPIPPPER